MNQQNESENAVSVVEQVCFQDVSKVVKLLEERLGTMVVSGVALHLVAVPNGNQATAPRPPVPQKKPTGKPMSGNGRITARQLKAIFAIGKSRGMTNQDIRSYCQEVFGKVPDFLTKQEASIVIDNLQEDET